VKTFAQLYAAQHGLPPAGTEREILLRSLYPHARLLYPVFEFAAPLVFAADIDLISDVAQLTDPRDFDLDLHAHRHHPEGGGLWRRFLFLRLSVGSLKQLVWQTFDAAKAGDPPPDGT
jgi:hypothetical protein